MPFFERVTLRQIATTLVALQVALGALAIAGSMEMLSRLPETRTTDDGRISVQLEADTAAAGAPSAEQALTIIRGTPGVIIARQVSRDAVIGRLSPWLGSDAAFDLPVPPTIDVTARGDIPAIADDIRRRLAPIGDVIVYDHQAQVASFRWETERVAMVLRFFVGVLSISTIATVAFAAHVETRTKSDAIEVFQIVGAGRAYTAHHFANRALAMAALGSILGLIAGCTAAFMVDMIEFPVDGIGSNAQDPNWHRIALLGVIPVAAAIVSYSVAWLTVMARLRS